ncbi:poly-beta-1,6-N-acetyl-D-glucosamine synthase [Acinetobacter sp. MB5]|uniref:poly-beta-1,6-N-acetyl-D-glucosamine synthase n=1 Tax=Acinetobacter sp. MB5 TaxID=2069438 RepID=UPI000DD0C2FE|nr:poly-beta-1,6-N-acetyl-D-glucosamine synthase [Acinetobacter sp. MB5]
MSWLKYLFDFAFLYPLFMAWIWIVGGIWFFFKREFPKHPVPRPTDEGCSILIPCFNEEEHIRDTIRYASQTQYPQFEIIAVNDGSTDRTGQILDELQSQYSNLRVVHLAKNQGKAFALRSAVLVSKYEYLICIDGDALLHPHAVLWMMDPMVKLPRVGAVTGNPRIINRSSILGKLQVGEFSSIIGLIKRAQRTYGRLFTVSGVIAGFRKTAVEQVGFWSDDKLTEDIDISWKLQFSHWDIQYIPQALCYIYMPETFVGLCKQRLRWAQGGMEVLRDYTKHMFKWRLRRMWIIILETIMSVTWSYIMLLIFILYFLGVFFHIPSEIFVKTLLPEWYGAILGFTCLIQFTVSLWIDKRYDGKHRFFRNYFWVIWYPLFFWLVTTLTTVVAVPRALFLPKKRARWVSPDRGFKGEKL